jgi:hypothetical protein
MGLLLVCTGFDALLLAVAATCLGDRAAKTLEMLSATRVAGDRRGAYRALARSASNAGYGIGAGLAAIGLAVGTRDAYRALILGDALSFVLAALLVRRTQEPPETQQPQQPPEPGAAAAQPAAEPSTPRRPSPWRDRGYLLFVLLDIPMSLDDSILNVGLPLWLVDRTSAPHALVPAFLILNTVMVVVLQVSVSARTEGARSATRALLGYGALTLGCCAAVAAATGRGPWAAAAALLAAALLVTLAELMRSVSSWELAVLLAPPDARAAYLGVAGMSLSAQKSVGPPLLTGLVTAAGPAGWLLLGTLVAGLAAVQQGACARRLGLTGAGRGRTPANAV